jgi:hypothetical protein
MAGSDPTIELPARLTLHRYFYALDGGTTAFQATDEAGRDRSVMCVQHSFPHRSSLDAIPGRLYFDGALVPTRSATEAAVLSLLKHARVQVLDVPFQWERSHLSPNALILGEELRQVFSRSPEDNVRALAAKTVAFVESERYLTFQVDVEQAEDPTRYDVWVAWDEESRKRVLVRLGQFLGVGLGRAAEMLDEGRPLATGLPALEVTALAKRYRAAGIGVRVSPEFRWRLPQASANAH